MDETQTPPAEVTKEGGIESTIPAQISDTTTPETVQRPPLDIPPEPSIQGESSDIVITPTQTEPELPVIQVDPTPTTEHSNILQRPEFSRPEGDENGSTPVVNVGISDSPPEEPRVVECVVEKVVEKEVIKEVTKEVPVER